MRNEEVRKILLDLHRTGDLTPERVVDVARDQSHPLHSQFEWDDEAAGEAYRRSQASDLIRSVRIRYAEDTDGKDKTVRGFVSVRPADAPHRIYRPVDEVMADPLQRQMLLRDARREFKAFEKKYGHLSEYAEIIAGEDAAAV